MPVARLLPLLRTTCTVAAALAASSALAADVSIPLVMPITGPSPAHHGSIGAPSVLHQCSISAGQRPGSARCRA